MEDDGSTRPVYTATAESVEATVEPRSGPHPDQDEEVSVDLEK
ncbi:MAG TPA: hypothetical protein VK424_00320 [Thermoplasmata archaeon]|nr:hypothetical protein [Thermoplasmata archaeon]